VPCLFCDNVDAVVNQHGDNHHVECQRCGLFSITDEGCDEWVENYEHRLTDRNRANISGWLREHQNILISTNDLDILLHIKSLSVSQRADKLLVELEKRTEVIGSYINVPTQIPEANNLMGLTWSSTPSEILYLAKLYLTEQDDYLIMNPRNPPRFAISPKGYAYLEKLRLTNLDSMIGFCAMWFRDTLIPVWTDAIEPAIEASGYDPKRIDRVEHNNRIDDEIIAMLRRSRFVVADFTGQRGGVYFESGFALGQNLPVIWTVRENELEGVHFDNRQYNFITWNLNNLADFQTKLQNRIEATIGRGPL